MDVEALVSGRKIRAMDVDTNYLEEGSGPPLILLHGSGPGVSGYANWGQTIPVLARHFRVIAPDLAGFGHSDPPDDAEFGLDYWVRHVIAFMDAMGIGRAHFLGNSFGGAIGIGIAVQHPERVDRLMLMGPAGLDYVPADVYKIDLSKGLTPDVMRQLVQQFTYYPDEVTEEMIELRIQTAARSGGVQRQARMFPGNPKLSRVSSMHTPAQLIATIKAPTLIVHGRDDKIMPISSSYRLNELISDSDLHIYSRCGHWSQLDRFGEFNTLAISFFGTSREAPKW